MSIVGAGGSPRPEGMTSLDPVSLNQSLEPVDGSGVGVEDDLGEAGDCQAEVHTRCLGQEDSGLDSLQTLSSETGGVEDVLDVGQPPAGGQSRHPLLRGHVQAGRGQLVQ